MEYVRHLYDECEDREQFVERLQERGVLTEFLRRYYGDERDRFYRVSVDGQERTYPLVSTDAWLSPSPNVNRPLEEFEPRMAEPMDAEFVDLAYVDHDDGSLDDRVRRLRNDPVYRLVDCDPERLALSFELTKYLSYVSDSEKVAQELLGFLHAEGVDDVGDLDGVVERARDELEERADRAGSLAAFLRAGEDHYYKVGVNAFTVVRTNRRPPEYKAVLYRRSADTIEYPNLYHVAPAGTFQPVVDDGDTEFDLKYHVLREWGEEIFSLDELEDPDTDAPTFMNENFEKTADLYDMLDDGDAHLFYTSLGFDLYTGKPEMGVTLFVDDASYFRDYGDAINSNWEHAGDDLTPLDDADRITEITTPGDIVPGGAMSIFEGLRLLDDRFDVDVPLDVDRRSPAGGDG